MKLYSLPFQQEKGTNFLTCNNLDDSPGIMLSEENPFEVVTYCIIPLYVTLLKSENFVNRKQILAAGG